MNDAVELYDRQLEAWVKAKLASGRTLRDAGRGLSQAGPAPGDRTGQRRHGGGPTRTPRKSGRCPAPPGLRRAWLPRAEALEPDLEPEHEQVAGAGEAAGAVDNRAAEPGMLPVEHDVEV